ncbi:MAG: hypothetical protein JWR60_3587 [Polaromonas sp.]|nr:hypothetical protein [Polaromonas sp.]
MWPKPRLAASALAALALGGCGSAWAHGIAGATASIWTAPHHLLTSPLSLAALIGLALVLFGIREPASFIAAALAGAAATLATALLPQLPGVLAPAGVVVIGLAAVAAWKPSTGFAFVLAVLAGLAAGSAAELEQARWQELAGIGITVLVAAFWLLASAENLSHSARLQPVLPLARRVLGSWITAIGLLLGALAVLGRHA